MASLSLVTQGVFIGTGSAVYTDEEKEQLRIFRCILKIAYHDELEVQIGTVLPDHTTWAKSQHQVINIIQQAIKDLTITSRFRLVPLEMGMTGEADEADTLEVLAISSAHAAFLKSMGYRVDSEVGLYDWIAFTIMQQYYRGALAAHGKYQDVESISTFEMMLPGQFNILSDAGKELLCLHKAIIIGLGGHPNPSLRLMVNTTMADPSKWPKPEVIAIEIAQDFIKDQMVHNRVVLNPRQQGRYFPQPALHALRAFEQPLTYQAPSAINHKLDGYVNNLPTTLASLIITYFDPTTVVANILVDIARISLDIASDISGSFAEYGNTRRAIGLPMEDLRGCMDWDANLPGNMDMPYVPTMSPEIKYESMGTQALSPNGSTSMLI